MCHTDSFLGNDRETNNETTFAAGQQILIRKRLGKHVPAAMDMHATIEELLETASSTRSVPTSYITMTPAV
jgi:hypothetical protein